MEQAFDVIIAGGGAAGILAAARLSEARPDLRIAVLEKEAQVGGRLRATTQSRQYSYGLNAMTEPLFNFWNATLKLDTEAPDLTTLVPRRHQRMGVLAGNKIVSCDVGQWFSAKGARTLGGLSAAKQWPEVEQILKPVAGASAASSESLDDEDPAENDEVDDKRQAFSHYWKGSRKAPAAVVIEHFSSAFGIPDVWGSAAEALYERAHFHSQPLHCGSFDEAFSRLMEQPSFKASVTVVTSCRIISAAYEANSWSLETEQGVYTAASLMVAQPPWQATSWLPRGLWPTSLLQIASKTKPVSVVVLSEQLQADSDDLPDVILVPSEKVQIVRNGHKEICFQATVDFELSVQAPAIVKAVRSLKRARKKLLTAYPNLVSEGDHIALHPFAWAQSPAQRDKRWLERLAKKDVNRQELVFCGDAYGASYDGDANLIRSLGLACETLLK